MEYGIATLEDVLATFSTQLNGLTTLKQSCSSAYDNLGGEKDTSGQRLGEVVCQANNNDR